MFKNSFSFKGRIKRLEYALSLLIVYLSLFFINLWQHYYYSNSIHLAYILIIWFSLAQGAKRCHDLNKPGWWQLIPFYFLFLLGMAGNINLNKYD